MEDNLLFKIFEAIDYPFLWLRKLSIPPCKEDDYDHRYTIVWPILGITFLIFNFYNNKWVYLLSIPFIILLILLLYKYKVEDSKLPKYFLLIVLMGILSGILWTKLCCGLLVDLLTFIGKLTGL